MTDRAKQYFFIFLRYYLPAILWMGVIFYFSSISGLRYTDDNSLEVILRKGAHFLEFVVLCFLFWRLFYIGHKISIRNSYAISLVLIIFNAIGDEFHQTFVAGRSGKTIDTIFDIISAILFLEIILIIVRKKIGFKNMLVIFLSVLALIGIEADMIKEGKKAIVREPVQIEKSEENIPKDIKDGEAEDKNNDVLQETEALKLETNQVSDNPDTQAIPKKMLIKVPFTSQAPFANWDALHEEACEEASLVMVKYYLDKKTLNKDIAEKEIQALVAYENKNYGDFKDTTAAETKKLAEDYYKINNLEVVYDFKAEDIKKYLAKGSPIIVPAAGRDLGNPNFTAPGPLYHNLVLVGYDGETIITNDPGTRKGEGYKYDIETLYNATHDFPGRPEDIRKGRKAMIVLE